MLRDKDEAIQQLRLSFESDLAKLEFYSKERAGMIERIQQLQSSLERAHQERERHQQEMRVVLEQLDRQKQRAQEKMTRLKAALIED
jgi:2-polyprenyl-6-methoxyphenol hydroxylase-like FAD-dependent oxidoreductase